MIQSHDNQANMEMDNLLQQLEQRMYQITTNHAAQMSQLTADNAAQMTALAANNAELLRKITQLEAAQAAYAPTPRTTATEYTDIVPNYATGNDIQLDAFKVIHEFSGDKKIYRSWRTQVSKMMKQIEAHKEHPKYAAALSIIRAKIRGPASDILINNNTADNIDAIIDRLDFSYSDQRPLYLIEAEMTSIEQKEKSLQEFYDAINQSLNMVLTKITMTYKEAAEQKSLIAETQSKAIRAFITGLNNNFTRITLYGNMPNSLSKAFAMAQTFEYDNQHLRLDKNQGQNNTKRSNELNPNNPSFRYQMQKWNPNAVPQTKPPQKVNEMDRSGQVVQRPYTPNKFQQKSSFPHANKSSSSPQHANKNQQINHVDESEEIYSVNGDSMDNNYDSETTDEQQSIEATEESIFLDE